MSNKKEREIEVVAFMKRALDPNDEYDGSDAMSRPEGDYDEEDGA